MFTGLIESVGEVAAVTPVSGGLRLRVRTSLAPELALGESVAVNGVCLTAVAAGGVDMHADISPETARVSTLGAIRPGAPVNLERSIRADARIGGHFVQGHVDATGTIAAVRAEGDSCWISVAFPAAHAGLLVRKGSIAIDGISLTIANLDDATFDVQIIPFTWNQTSLSQLKTGAVVNLEFDILGKYVARALELRR